MNILLTLLTIIIIIICVIIWWYYYNDKKQHTTHPAILDHPSNTSITHPSNMNINHPEEAIGSSIDQILNKTDVAQLVKSINTNLDQLTSNQALYPPTGNQEQQNDTQMYYIYTPLANALVAKYGLKLNNLKLMNNTKQKQMPSNFSSASNLPLVISNYLWYIISASNGPSLSSEENMNKCLVSVMSGLKSSMTLTSNNTLNFTNNEDLGKFENGIASCVSNSGAAMSVINQLVPQINNDLKFVG